MMKRKFTTVYLLTALAIVVVSLVGCNTHGDATTPTSTEQTEGGLGTTRGPTEGTTGMLTETTVANGVDGTEPETSNPDNINTTVPPTNPVQSTGPTEATSPVATTVPTETTGPAVVATEPSEPVTTSHTHSYTNTVVAATCTSKGYTKHTCRCGYSYNDSETAELGHDYVSTVVQPTCAADGYTNHVCSRCGSNYTDAITAKLTEHSWGEWTVVREATTEAVGLERRYCNYCNAFENRSIAKLDPFENEEYLQQFLKDAAAYTVQYINQFRVEQGGAAAEVLPGLTQVAEYRAVQLQENYSHNATDLRAALARYQYGKWVDATKAGLDASYSYYSFPGREAIAKSNRQQPTAIELGKAFAEAAKNSEGHWRYVGSSDYLFIAVGISYNQNASDGYPWKCEIMMCNTEEYG